LQSKTDAQTYGWLGYILKDDPDKYIVFKDDPKLVRSLLYKDKNRRK
jgi:hypothetical protein